MTIAYENFGDSWPGVPKILFSSFSSEIPSLEIRAKDLNAINDGSTFDFDLANLVRHLAEFISSRSSEFLSPVAVTCTLHLLMQNLPFNSNESR